MSFILTYDAIAKRIDHSLLGPTLARPSSRTAAGSRPDTAWRASASSRTPSTWPPGSSRGTGVEVGTTIGFPHGGHSTAVKVFESRQAMADGATELDMVINIGQAIAGEWDAVTVRHRRGHQGGPRRRRDREGHLRELLSERRPEDPPLPDLRRGRRRLRQDLHRLRDRGRHLRGPPIDATGVAAARQAEGGRRRPDPRRDDPVRRARLRPDRGLADRRDPRRAQGAGSG